MMDELIFYVLWWLHGSVGVIWGLNDHRRYSSQSGFTVKDLVGLVLTGLLWILFMTLEYLMDRDIPKIPDLSKIYLIKSQKRGDT